MALPLGLQGQTEPLKATATHDLVRGAVLNELEQGVSGVIEFLDPRTDKVVQTAQLNAEGKFELLLPKNRQFYFIIRTGCLTHYFKDEGHILKTSTEDVPTSVDLGFSVYQYAAGTEIVLGTLVFPSNGSEIAPEHEDCLRQFAEYLNAHPTMLVQVTGHTDNVGSPDENKILSKARAVAVKNHMIDQLGIDESRLSAYGYGHTLPITTNDTENGRSINRRVSFIVVKP
jgi:outer membrane protein OmpA-like peptidoglycan-associated protein